MDEKQIRWVGSAYDDLLAFPKDARKEAGFQLGKVQAGLEPAEHGRSRWRPGCGAVAAARYRAVVNARKQKK